MDTMLIVDDNEIDRNIIANYFAEDFMILEAQSGEECFRILKEYKYNIDIVLLDNWLPDMTGVDILKERKLDERFADIPVIIVTVNNDSVNLIESFKNGADDYITKPLVREVIKARVSNVLIATRKYAEMQKKNRELSELSEIDQMTGLYNKMTTVNKINQQLHEHKNHIDAIIVVDMDDFKYINDSEGHLIGDHAIRRVSRILKDNFRKEDIIGRIGGDEFVVFLNDIPDKEIARRKARDIIRIFKVKKSTVIRGRTTVSIGLAFADSEVYDYKELFDRADKALAEAKKYGKACYHEYGIDDYGTYEEKRESVIVYSKSRTICHVIDKAISSKYNVIEVISSDEIDKVIKQQREIRIIIADLSNDEDDGKLIMDYLDNNKDIAGIPKIAVCKESNIEQCKIAIQGGVVDLMMEPIEKDIVRRRVSRIIKDEEK